MRLMAVIIAVLLGGCVPYPGELPPVEETRKTYEGPFEPLDAGASELSGLHFLIKAYGEEGVQSGSAVAEKAYSRIMIDTNLYSFKPKGLYHITIYKDVEEYRRKTAMPNWSAGVTVHNAIFSYEGPHLAGTLAHEMAHVIFHEFMGRAVQEHRWINEGLAVYEESLARGNGARMDIFAAIRGNMRREPLSMEELVRIVPATEESYKVNLWYAQAESMVRFLIERGGRIGFSQFLMSLKAHMTLDGAFRASFPGVWNGVDVFEREWKRSQM